MSFHWFTIHFAIVGTKTFQSKVTLEKILDRSKVFSVWNSVMYTNIINVMYSIIIIVLAVSCIFYLHLKLYYSISFIRVIPNKPVKTRKKFMKKFMKFFLTSTKNCITFKVVICILENRLRALFQFIFSSF